MLACPETWDPDLDDFLTHYIFCQKIFLDVLQDCENELIQSGVFSPESPRLSGRMAQSLDNSTFWFYLAATYSFAFDGIYWSFIHPKHYGPFHSVEDLVKLSSIDEQDVMETFACNKMLQEKNGNNLDSHRTIQETMND